MDADQIQAWAESIGVSPSDEGFGIMALAYTAGQKAAFEEAAKASRLATAVEAHHVHMTLQEFIARQIEAIAAREKEPR